MVTDISELSLEPEILDEVEIDESSVELLEAEELEGVQDDRPHLVFLIPGIRTNGWWAQEARMQELLWDGREVHFVPIRGNGGNTDRLSTWHLLSRIGLKSFRNSFIIQMKAVTSKREYASVNVFAHSMGSALFADIVETLVEGLPGSKYGAIAFLGSVCHRKHGIKLFNCSDRFVNDVGTSDYWPYIASTFRPDSYSDVGFTGFLNAFAFDRFFAHNHQTCTSFEHIKTQLVPLISTSEVKPLGSPRATPRYFNTFIYAKRTVWTLAILSTGWLLARTIL